MSSWLNKIVRAITFAIGLLILVYLMNSVGLEIFPDVFYSATGAFILFGLLIFGAFWLE